MLLAQCEFMQKVYNGISIIVPARNEQNFIGLCIDSLLNQDFDKEYEIIVVDNMSIDSTREIAKAKGVTVLRCPVFSPSSVRNVGASRANFDILAFIDGDCEASVSWLTKAYNFFCNTENVGAYGGPCVIPDKSNWIVEGWTPHHKQKGNTIQQVQYLAGSNLFITKSAFIQCKGFNESLITAEDDEICERITSNCLFIYNDPGNTVVHHGYPDTLFKLLKQSIWHGSTQINAMSLLKNKILLLTIIWASLILLLSYSIFSSIFALTVFSIISIIIATSLLAHSRLKNLSLSKKISIFHKTSFLAAVVLLGRTIGLCKEVGKYCKAVVRFRPYRGSV